MSRLNLRQALECGSPLPLSIAPTWPETRQGVLAAPRALPKRQRTAALQNLARTSVHGPNARPKSEVEAHPSYSYRNA